ncbi:FAD-dependent oxidoreductase [Parendozoicomonas sp. Alg238-R29]|uniref:FAD-dependent oxidoreductase n=1 Tax=Parendozoicomonas sp. Alg238-R29 TaxID=2993446 RepID=UPI00248D84D2|nr:FAD-dependent oxidoreductase [Parendozoicomonas sp. Alg238-R29]
MKPLSILISGAGITGLAAARSLSEAGHNVQVIERVFRWRHSGAGIALPANATLQLDKLGVS